MTTPERSLVDIANELNLALDGKSLEEAMEGPMLEVISLMDQAKPYLTDKSLQALSKETRSEVYHDASGVYVCIYLSVIVRENNVLEGIKAIASDVNTLSEKGLIHSALSPIGTIRLAHTPLRSLSQAVYAFVLVPGDRLVEANSLVKYAHKEGELGPTLGSLEPELPEGEFLAAVYISAWKKPKEDIKAQLDAEIEMYLAVLPKGTTVVSVEKRAIVDLSIPYEVRFKNPLMKDYKEVRLEFMREAVNMGDKVEQFNLLREVEYIKRGSK